MTRANQARIDADRDLVRRILAGDRRAFDEFTDDYLPPLYRFASRRVRDREITVEVVQATVCKAIEKLATFRGEAALMTWLCATCRNEIAGYFRDQGRRRMEQEFEAVEQVTAMPLAQSGIDGPEQATRRRETASLVHDALDSLPPRYARALEWKYLEGVTVREIGRRLSVSTKAAESLLTRARGAFRDRYRGAEPDTVTERVPSAPGKAALSMMSRGNP